MTLAPLTYLSMDSVGEGIGLSQVARYVERLATRGADVTLHSFEKGPPDRALSARFESAGVRWVPHRFVGNGSAAGLVRVAQGAALIRGAELVHARSDMAAASALLGRRRAWVWDVRAFWREQRVALGTMRAGSAPERTMRSVEQAAARSCTGIVTLTEAAVEVLRDRYGDDVAAKARVITTCVDLDLFSCSPMPPSPPVRLLLSGTLNRLYDVPTMITLIDRLAARRPTDLTVLAAEPTPWNDRLAELGFVPRRALPAEMPEWVRQHHLGLSVLRTDMGISSRAVMPTKIGEFLASGRPVVVNAGLGDMDRLLPKYDCGVVLRGGTEADLDDAVDEIERLVDDEDTPDRCRRLAEDRFSLDRGVEELLGLYQRAVG